MLFYYPYKDGKETRPVAFVPFACLPTESKQRRKSSSIACKVSPSVRGGKGLSQRTSSSSNGASSADVINLAEDSESDCDPNEKKKKRDDLLKTVSVFWQNRCVPNSFAQRLPFFPTANSNLECSNAHLPMRWRNRIKCYLFFDSNFSHISNNKLQLLFDQGLENWFEQNKKVRL